MILNARNEVSMENFKNTLKVLDRPFIKDVYYQCVNNSRLTNKNFLAKYLNIIQNEPLYCTMSYNDGEALLVLHDEENEVEKKVEKLKADKEDRKNYKATDEMRFFWTNGMTDIPDKEICILQQMYDEYTNNGDSSILSSKKVQDDFRTLCILELQKSKLQYNIEMIKDYQNLQKMCSDLSESLGIKAIQKQNKFDSNKFTLGLIARYQEDVVKEPIPRWCEDLGHYNAMKDLIKVHYLGGIGIAMGLSTQDIEAAKQRLSEFEVELEQQVEEDEEVQYENERYGHDEE